MSVSNTGPFSWGYCLRVLALALLPITSVFAQSGTPVAARTSATPTQQNPSPQQANKDAIVVVLGYHRFEDRPRDMLAIHPQAFREQMQTLKNRGIPVISLKDFLSWRKGEKAIPARSVLITIDDGYLSGYATAWPILKEFGYPFVMYLYTNYVNVGGKSMTWDQLREMRDAGVEFGNHSASHDNMVHPKKLKGGNYQEWLKNELFGSKQILESQLNVPINTFAFPYGIHNAQIREDALKNGYVAMFTVNPVPIRFSSPAGALGRFIISSTHPATFKNALRALEGAAGGIAVHEARTSSPLITTEPKNDENIDNPLPEIKADLAPFGNVQSESVRLAISGFGPVSANYDPATKQLSYKITRPLREKKITVFLSAKNETGPVGTTWTFHYDPKLKTTPR
ncbi:MAG: hypothetical protein C5B47_01775 [Verrucomicrobia bacterium]|nr:MAG: hypothetical protein C5B47_01775 [Verrucomicrobiota bacterium]